MAHSGLLKVRGISGAAVGLIIALVLGLALAGSMIGAPEAGAAKLTACVNKKTGAMRLVSGKKAKKKCPKGWRKVTWEKDKGRNGLQVVSADGKVVGILVGMSPIGTGVNAYTVLRNGGIYSFLGGGQLYPTSAMGSLPEFKTADCSGPAYIGLDGAVPAGTLDFYKGLFGGPFRLIFRTLSPLGLGPASSWKFQGVTEDVLVDIPLYELQSDGTCDPSDPTFTGTLFQFDSEAAPPDFKGPLKIR